jgi:hypothetical protein
MRGGVAALAGVATFLVVVGYLHVVQPHYDPVHQLMSELALDHHGGAMFFAFAGFAVAFTDIQFSIARLGAHWLLRALLALSAVCFLAAGIFPLGETALEHIVAIACAFVTAVIAIYLFPSLAGRAAALAGRSISWSAAAGVALSVALGHTLLPMGVAQRMAAGCLLAWIMVVGYRLCRRQAEPHAPSSS